MRSFFIVSTIIFIVTLGIYWQTVNHDFVSYDDGAYVTDNPHVNTGLTGANLIWAFTETYQANWHPLTWLTHMADVEFYGLNPRGHHLTNVFIHIASALLVYILFARLTGSPWQSAFVAAIFALHPLHVESVAWVAERKDVLCGFFWFLTLLLYGEYVIRRHVRFYFAALLSFMLGIMSKPMIVTLPVVMLLLDYWPLNRFGPEDQPSEPQQLPAKASCLLTLVKEKSPFLAGSLLISAATIWAQHSGGAIQTIDAVPLGLRIANALTACLKYLVKTLWPDDLAVLYPLPATIPRWEVLLSLCLLLTITAAALKFRRNQPYIIVGWLWFLITLLPVIGLIQVGFQAVADRYMYIPMTGLAIIATWGGQVLIKTLNFPKSILAVVAFVALCFFSITTWKQLSFWKNSVYLFENATKVTINNYIAHSNLGSAYFVSNRIPEAIEEYRKSIGINPDYIKSHYNLGLALAKTGHTEDAINEFLTVIEMNPAITEVYYYLGLAYSDLNYKDKAIYYYRKALALEPGFPDAEYNLDILMQESPPKK